MQLEAKSLIRSDRMGIKSILIRLLGAGMTNVESSVFTWLRVFLKPSKINVLLTADSTVNTSGTAALCSL